MRLFIAALACALLAAPAAHAFTMDNQSNTNSDGSARYTDPDQRFSNPKDGKSITQGNTTFRFGNERSFDQRYNPNQMFDPVGRPQTER
jgi:hypothetical protein